MTNNQQQSINPKVSPVYTVMALALVVAFGCFAPTRAQWTTPDASQNINNTNTGNVGIGTTTPTSLLEVKKSQSAGTTINIDNPFTTAGNSAYSGLFLRQAGVNRLLVSSVNDNHGSITPGTAQFWNFANGPTVFANNNTETMRLSAVGYLGIGTNSPGERLVTFGNMVAGNITSHTQLYSTYDSQANSIMEVGYGTATANITPLASLVLSKNLTSTNQGLGVISFANSNIANGNEKRLSSISAWTDGALNSGAMVFGTSLTGTLNEQMRITSNGNIGIGTTTPTQRLEVNGSALINTIYGSSASAGTLSLQSTSNATKGTIQIGFDQTSTTKIGQSGTPGDKLLVASDRLIVNNAGVRVNGAADYSDLSVTKINITNPDALQFRTSAPNIQSNGSLLFTVQNVNGDNVKFNVQNSSVSNAFVIDTNSATPAKLLDVRNLGTSKFTVSGNGDVTIAGNIAAKYQDVAEWVESSQELSPGTVVVLDQTKSNQVIASTQAYDSSVAGVISLKPGITLGERGEGHVLVATTGRVKVKVDATNGPIKIGDLLVTSDREGVAMKSTPVEFGGVRMHRPGTLIGKALEPLAQGTGEILVLLSLQ